MAGSESVTGATLVPVVRAAQGQTAAYRAATDTCV